MPLADVSSRYTDLVESVFSTAIAGKAWLATGAFVLAFVQVLTASRMWGKLERFVPLSFSTSRRIHRWSGRIALLLTLPVIFHCVMILGFETTGPTGHGALHRRLLHLRRGRGETARDPAPQPQLPVVGAPRARGTLAAVLTTLWLTSSLWYFTNVRFGF